MTWEIQLARRASSFVKRLDPRTQERILGRLDQIATDPHGAAAKALRNAGGRRSARVGDYRIIFSSDAVNRVVFVSAIDPRGQVYRDL